MSATTTLNRSWGRAAAWLAGLTAMWILLVGQLRVANVVGGLLAAAAVMVAAPVAAPAHRHRVRVWASLRFGAFVLVNLVTSSVAVVLAVLAPTPARLRSGIVRVELPGAGSLVTTLVANAITLTPGTLTVAAEVGEGGAVLHVHVLGLGDVEAFRAGVADLHRRAAAAAGPVGGVEVPR